MTQIDDYLKKNRRRFESDLFEWLRIPSIGTDPAYDTSTREAALWLSEKFNALGLQTELIETCGHPLVFAQSPPVPNAPVVLIYGHYDVQPPDPLELWTTPPFQPTVRDGKVYARGATDDKGQMITHLFGVEAVLNTKGELPVQVKFLIEGEEESGGAGLKAFLRSEYDGDVSVKERLAADIAVISDCSQLAPGRPAITLGLRGIVHFEINLMGPHADLHSGYFGGAVSNPANAVFGMLGSIVDSDGRIQIPGFYDGVIDLTSAEREAISALGFSESNLQSDIGVNSLVGETGYSALERRWCRPTFDIHGLGSGYQGEGAKTVLPSKAGAKFSFRLVPGQDPQKVKSNVMAWLKNRCPPGIKLEIEASDGVPGFVLPLESEFVKAAVRAIEVGFGTRPAMIRSGGSIPVVSALLEVPGVETLLLGWGQDDDNLHSPDERFLLDDFHKGIKTSSRLLNEFAKI